ncbi:MAG: serine protease [Patescibacteria group bacterium]|nr:serine protease [Patescibacteria group bacterium]
MRKDIKNIFIMFIFGIFGGIFANQVIGPYFTARPVYVTERQEITIEENTALKESAKKVEKTVVGVMTQTKENIFKGSGLMLTSDGLMITLAELVPQGGVFTFFVEGRPSNYQVLKRDLNLNLALIKLEQDTVSTVGFADFNKLEMGERVFLVGTVYGIDEFIRSVNEGIISHFDNDLISTNILERTTMAGSPLFNINGEFVGLTVLDYWGAVSAIPVSVIKTFAGF